MIKRLLSSKITKASSLICLILVFLSDFTPALGSTVFEQLRPIATEGLHLSTAGKRSDLNRALPMLEEFMVRAQDWVNSDNREDVELMGNVIASVIELKRELQGIDSSDLIKLLFPSAVSSVTAEDFTYKNMPDIFPKIDGNDSASLPDIDDAVSAMRMADMKHAEYILLELYNHTWLNGDYESLRYSVANKMILFYLRLGLHDNAFKLLRQNKIEMDRNSILNKDYLECLFYFAMHYISTGEVTLGNCYLEVADEILSRTGCDVSKILEDYDAVMSRTDEPGCDGDLYKFISSNDAVFCFLTEQERTQRWKAFSDSWRTVKRNILKNMSSYSDLNDLLNAFQYEKYLMLRSYSKIATIIHESGDEEAIEMLRQLNSLRMNMTNSFGEEWHNFKAEYQRIQKELMHHPVLSTKIGNLYHVISTSEISSHLSEEETFIDFGVINDGNEETYFALVINKDLPQGRLIKLCGKSRLHSFLDKTACKSTPEMVRNRYEDKEESLYDMIWRPLQESGVLKTDILYSPAEEINMIMPEAIQHHGMYLAESHNFHILTSCESIGSRNYNISNPKMAAFYDIAYMGDRQALIADARKYGSKRPLKRHALDDDQYGFIGAFSIAHSIYPLPNEIEYEWLTCMAEKSDVKLKVFSGLEASEYAFKNLSTKNIDIVHVSTHAFYIPSSSNPTYYPYIISQDLNLENCEKVTGNLLPMFRAGLFFSGSERHWCGRNCIDGIEDGMLNAEEMSALDLHNVKLISLLGCSTGCGEVDEFEGVIGLRRALKMAGCKSIISTAWNIDKEAALTYVNALYDNIFKSENFMKSHVRALHKVMERFESPYYWAPFQLID